MLETAEPAALAVDKMNELRSALTSPPVPAHMAIKRAKARGGLSPFLHNGSESFRISSYMSAQNVGTN